MDTSDSDVIRVRFTLEEPKGGIKLELNASLL